MALTDIDEAREFNLRMAQMEADTHSKVFQVRRVQQDWRLDPTRVIVSAFLAGAAIMGAGGTALGFFLGRGH